MSRTAQDSFNRTKPRREADAPHSTPTLPTLSTCTNCAKGLHDLDCKGAVLDLVILEIMPCGCYCTRGMETPC